MLSMPTMPTMPTYADVLRTPWSPKEKLEEKRYRQVRLLDVLEECLEECPVDSKPIDDADDADDGASCSRYSLTGGDWDTDSYRGLRYDEDEEEEGREWNDWWTWGSMHRYRF